MSGDYDDRLITCPECRSTFEAEDSTVSKGVTVTEWGVRPAQLSPWMSTSPYFDDGILRAVSREHADRCVVLVHGKASVVTRQRTRFPNVVTEWAEVTR